MTQLPAREVYKFIDGFERKSDFFEFARGYLKLKNNEVNDICDDYSNSREQKYQTICLWKRKAGRAGEMRELHRLKAVFDSERETEESDESESMAVPVEQSNMSSNARSSDKNAAVTGNKPSVPLQSTFDSAAPSTSPSLSTDPSNEGCNPPCHNYEYDTAGHSRPREPISGVVQTKNGHHLQTKTSSLTDRTSLIPNMDGYRNEATEHAPYQSTDILAGRSTKKGPIPEDLSFGASDFSTQPKSQHSGKGAGQHIAVPRSETSGAGIGQFSDDLSVLKLMKLRSNNEIAHVPVEDQLSKTWESSPPVSRKPPNSELEVKIHGGPKSIENEINNSITDQFQGANVASSSFCDEVVNLEVKNCNPQEKQEIDKKDNKYDIKNKPKGYVLIINNNFKLTKSYRVGAERDVANMKKLWESLDCSVSIQQDKKKEEVMTILQKIGKSDKMKKYDFFVLFIMSHGRLLESGEGFKTADGHYITVETVLKIFDTKDCPNLIEKPKLFFFQFCRGKEVDNGYSQEDEEQLKGVIRNMQETSVSDADRVQDDSGDVLHPYRCDLFISYATLLGFKSYRSRNGSWFINAIANIFSRYAKVEHVAEMMTRVREAVRVKTGLLSQSDTSNIKCKEMSESRDLLSKRLFLMPGYPEDDLL